MLGLKINEFDNTDGTLESFYKIFKNLELQTCKKTKYVEIGDIVEERTFFMNNPCRRELIFYDENYKKIDSYNYDFGKHFFYENFVFSDHKKIKYKYVSRDLEGKVLAVAYSMEEMAKKMNCNQNIIRNKLKRALKKPTKIRKNKELSFNITQKEV